MMIMYRSGYVLAVIVLVFRVCISQSGGNQSDNPSYPELESRLFKQLFTTREYNKFFRPERRTVINYALSLATLVELNEKSGYITTTFIPKMTWHDPRLAWNVSKDSEFAEVTHLQVPASQLWLPDIEILNRFKDSIHDDAMESLAWVHYDGVIYYVPRQTYQTPCTFDLDEFPFDSHQCAIILGSWAYQKDEVDIQKMANGTDDMFYAGHSDFSLTNMTMERVDSHYGSGDTPFVEIVVEITLSRRSTFFYYMYLLPADLLLFVLPLVHFIPPNRDSKFFLLSSILICTVLMMNTLEDFMPGYYSSKPPKALKLYFSCMLSVLFSGLISCITMSLANTDAKSSRIPLIFQKLLSSKLSRLCCVCGQSKSYDYKLLHLEKSILERTAESDYEQCKEMSECNGDAEALHGESSSGQSETAGRMPAAVLAIQALIGELQLMRFKEQVKVEWVQLSQLIDRLAGLGFIFSALVILANYHS